MTLWLCSKFSVGFPYLSHFPFAPGSHDQGNGISSGSSSRGDKPLYVRNQGAAPPVYRLIIAFVPLAVASFIATSRWMDHRHHGFDIIFGSVMGVAFAWVGFQLYNIPIRRGAGWSWGPRSRQYAFFKGVGFPSHVGHNNWARLRKTHLTGIEARRPGMDTESASAALV